MGISSLFSIIIVAALIHASFQLSISMLTLLSSHTIGKKRSHGRLVLLTNAFIAGAGVMTLLLLCGAGILFAPFAHVELSWTIASGLLAGVGVSTWLFYYRHEAGTKLWVPRVLARYLTKRTKATKQSGEAFGLGLGSVVSEILFIIAPVSIAALAINQLSPSMQFVGIIVYALISLGSLFVISGLIANNQSISRIQKWRESNKQFLQFSAGSGLVLLALYVYTEQLASTANLIAGGGL